MTDKRKELISSIISRDQYKEMDLKSNQVDELIYKDKKDYVFSKDLFDLDAKLFSVMKNVYNMDVVTHRHDFYEIQYVYSGSIKQNINGHQVTLNKGSLTLFNTNVSHDIKAGTSADRMYHIAIDESVLTRAFFDLVLEDNPAITYFKTSLADENYADYLTLDYSHPIYMQYFEAIETEYYYRQDAYKKNIMMYLALIFNKIHIKSEQGDLKSLKEKRKRHIKGLIEENYQDMTLKNISRKTPCTSQLLIAIY